MNEKIETKVVLTGLSLVPQHGGLPKTMRKFREALDAQIVSFSSPKLPTSEIEAFSDIHHVMTSSNPLLDWYGYVPGGNRKSAEEIAGRADLMSCHVMLRYHAHWVRKMAKKSDIPYWFVPHGQLDPYVYTYRAWIKHVWLKLFGKRLMREAAHVIYSTKQERDKAKWFYDGANTRVIHWPVNLIDLSHKEEAQRAVREDIQVGKEDTILFYFGRIHSMKNPLETIDAVAGLGDSHLHLVIAGPDGDVTADDCCQRAEKKGVAGQVHVLGPIYGEEKVKWLLGADAFVSLSHRENFGHTAAESLAAATPVLLSPGNDLSPELRPYDCGWFLQSIDPKEVVDLLRVFMGSSADNRKEMGLRGRRFIAEECSFDHFQKSLFALRDEAIQQHHNQK